MSTTAPRADAAAASVGASDLFVLRRVTGSRFVHFGGSGRGAGWAGLIEVSADEEIAARRGVAHAPARPARPRREGARLRAVLRARGGLRPVTNDLVVVFGCEGRRARSGERREPAVGSDPRRRGGRVGLARQAARRRARGARGGARARRDPHRRHRCRRCARSRRSRRGRSPARSRRSTSRTATGSRSSARAGSCGRPRRTSRRRCAACSATIASRTASRTRRSCRCRRRSTAEPGIRSYYLLELQGARAACSSSRTPMPAPRGFTTLCRRLGVRLAGVASAQLGVALTQTWCSEEAARLHAAFGQLDLG